MTPRSGPTDWTPGLYPSAPRLGPPFCPPTCDPGPVVSVPRRLGGTACTPARSGVPRAATAAVAAAAPAGSTGPGPVGGDRWSPPLRPGLRAWNAGRPAGWSTGSRRGVTDPGGCRGAGACVRRFPLIERRAELRMFYSCLFIFFLQQGTG